MCIKVYRHVIHGRFVYNIYTTDVVFEYLFNRFLPVYRMRFVTVQCTRTYKIIYNMFIYY